MITKEKLIDLLEKIARGATLDIDENAMSITPIYQLLSYTSVEDHVKAIVKNLHT